MNKHTFLSLINIKHKHIKKTNVTISEHSDKQQSYISAAFTRFIAMNKLRCCICFTRRITSVSEAHCDENKQKFQIA